MQKKPRLKKNARNQMRAWTMLRQLDDRSVKLAFLDPQYRSVLEKLGFGNEGAKQKARAELPQMTDHDIGMVIEQCERVLVPGGHLLLWVDKFAIGSGRHLWYMRFTKAVRVVDLLAWDTGRFGMGRRFRSATEYLVVVQKEPVRAKGLWRDHGMRDFWTEKSDRDNHPHAKPRELTERLIKALTRPGDLVIDPCAGGFGVLDACKKLGRDFIGCDIQG